MPTEEPSVLVELFKATMMTRVRRAILVHEALSKAYLKRTGQVLERESDYTPDDVKRAVRILRAENLWRDLL